MESRLDHLSISNILSHWQHANVRENVNHLFKLKYLLHQIFAPDVGFGVNGDLGLKKYKNLECLLGVIAIVMCLFSKHCWEVAQTERIFAFKNFSSSIACVLFISFKERFVKYRKVKYGELMFQMALFIFSLFNLSYSVILIVRSQYFKAAWLYEMRNMWNLHVFTF